LLIRFRGTLSFLMQYLQDFGNPGLLANQSNPSLLSQPISLSQFVNPSFHFNVFPLNVHQPFLSVFPMQPVLTPAQANIFYNPALMLRTGNNIQAQAQPHMMKTQNPSLQNSIGPSNFPQKGIFFDTQINNENFPGNQFLPEICDANKSIKAHLKDIIYFVLKNFGACSEEEIKREMLKYRKNQELVVVFEALLHNYSSTIKTKEDILNHILKKALKFMKQKVKKDMKNHNASLSNQKKTFQAFLEGLSSRLEEDTEENKGSSQPLPSNKF